VRARLGGRGGDLGEIRDGLAVRSGAARPLAAATATLRIRLFYSPDDPAPLRAVLALKRHPRIEVGVNHVEEGKEPLVSWR
jgi:hypothetical protein